jgi:hypothetical protein
LRSFRPHKPREVAERLLQDILINDAFYNYPEMFRVTPYTVPKGDGMEPN